MSYSKIMNNSMIPQQIQDQDTIIIGYFHLRAKAQVARLLCEYLGVKYKDVFFTQDQWQRYRQTQAKNWSIQDIPFLKHKSFVVTGKHAINEYIIRISNNTHFFGTTLKDQLFIDIFKVKYDLKENIISLICSIVKKSQTNRPIHEPEYYWKNVIHPRLKELEENCGTESWYFGYLTVIDFYIYELMNYLYKIFSNMSKLYPKLIRVRQKIKTLDRIKEYQSSSRAVKVFNPFNCYKEGEILKNSYKVGSINTSNISNNSSNMNADNGNLEADKSVK